jgi:WhiB family redox-sensing transcriptional regulator
MMTLPKTSGATDDHSPPGQEWSRYRACLDLPVGFFYPRKYESAAEAKSVCLRCPVRVECLESALVMNERYGVWGGTDERERRTMLRARRRPTLAQAG